MQKPEKNVRLTQKQYRKNLKREFNAVVAEYYTYCTTRSLTDRDQQTRVRYGFLSPLRIIRKKMTLFELDSANYNGLRLTSSGRFAFVDHGTWCRMSSWEVSRFSDHLMEKNIRFMKLIMSGQPREVLPLMFT